MDKTTLLGNFRRGLEFILEDERLHQLATGHNEWFLPGLIRNAIEATLPWFDPSKVETLTRQRPKCIGIIMAGNLPLVGLQDLLMVLLTGHHAHIKTSSKDSILIRRLVSQFDLELRNRIQFQEDLDPHKIDFLIGTGSNNTARYLNHHFADVPKLVRGNRYSVAVLTGDESKEDLEDLSRDILLYHGMGCRSVSNLMVPKGYRFEGLITALHNYPSEMLAEAWARVVKWENAIHKMKFPSGSVGKRVAFWKGEHLRTVPVGVVNWITWNNEDHLRGLIEAKKDELQCIVGKGQPIAFGQSQFPDLYDFADEVNTFDLLKELN